MLLLATALFALALPIIGPLDDHHFAERSHAHDHIYLNGGAVAHNHAYDGLALHTHRESGRQSSQPAGWHQENGVLYLTPAAPGLTLSALNAPYHPAPESLRPPPPPEGRDNLLERFAPSSGRAQGTNIPPSLPPPVI